MRATTTKPTSSSSPAPAAPSAPAATSPGCRRPSTSRTPSRKPRARPRRSCSASSTSTSRSICRLNGHATGLGASLALLSDIVIAAEPAKIGDPHVSVGLVAGDGGALIWPQLIGYAKAKRYLFTGDLLTAAEAERIGLISEVVPEADLDSRVYGLAERLAAGPLKAMKWTKVVANLPLKALFHAHFDAGVAYESMSNLSADHQEAVAAFREKRKPAFTGK